MSRLQQVSDICVNSDTSINAGFSFLKLHDAFQTKLLSMLCWGVYFVHTAVVHACNFTLCNMHIESLLLPLLWFIKVHYERPIPVLYQGRLWFIPR